MGKFKVGDRVRPKRTSDFLNVVETYEVSGIAPSTSFAWVWLEGVRNRNSRDGSFREDDLELIEPDAATTENWDFDPRRELKIGDRVRALIDDDTCDGFGVGDTFFIEELDGDYIIFFDNDGDRRLKEAADFVLVTDTTAPEPDADLSVRVVADMSQLDGEIDRILRRLRKVEKRARKLGIRLEFRDAA